MTPSMTSAQRFAAVLSQRLPDRVPFVLPVVMQGARELGLSIADYFRDPEAVVEGQLRLRARYRHDALLGFLYSAQEIEAFGGDTIFRDDGPPNAGVPVIRTPSDIDRLRPPNIDTSPTLQRVLRVIRLLKSRAGDDVPVFGSVIAPFSLPVMQMGFEAYLLLMHEDPARHQRLLQINEEFAVAWANAQLQAGAYAITYADPVGSPTIVPLDLYRRTGFPLACRTISRIQGACAMSFASGRSLAVIEEVVQTGVKAMVACAQEGLATTKAACRGRLVVMGALDAIAMRRWTPQQAEQGVKDAIAQAGPGGGYVLSDHHGEIPWQVPDEVLMAISDAVHRWGAYPLDWVSTHGS